MNRNKKITQTMALAMTGIMIANAGMGSVYAADQTASVEKETESTTEAVTEKETEKETEKVKKETSKEETVYVQASPSGETQEIIVSDWLKNTDGETSLSDKSDLSDIKNVKGDETFSQDGDKITWDANGNDIYYQGTSTKDLPVSLKVTYYLDGQEISPEDLAGKSGHVKMVYQYTNHMKQGEIYTPFVLFTGMVLPGDNFSNVKVDNGKTISDGDKNIVIGVGLPGLEDSLKIKKNKSDILDDLDIDLDIPDSFEVEADVTDFSLSMSMTVATPLSLDDLELDDIDDEDDLKDKIDEIADAATQLVDGTSDLADGVQELKDGCGDLLDGIDQLDDGAGDLNNGVQTLNNKKGDLIDGINQLSSGLDQLNSKKGDLVKGVNQLTSGASSLDSGAADLKTGMDQLAAGVTTLDQNRPALMEGLKALITGVNQLEGKDTKDALTGGAVQIADGSEELESKLQLLKAGSTAITNGLKQMLYDTSKDGLKPGLEKLKDGLKNAYNSVYAVNHEIDGVEGSGSVARLTNGIPKYVGGVNELIRLISQSNTETEGQKPVVMSEEAQEQKSVATSVDVSVDVSFADTNADAVASLEASIAGNEAVLGSLEDVKSHLSGITGGIDKKVLEKYSDTYNQYSGQLDNNIAQLKNDIANQKSILAALQEKQTITTQQDVEVENANPVSVQDSNMDNEIATQDTTTTPSKEDIIKNLQEEGGELKKGAEALSKEMGRLETGLKEVLDGVSAIYNNLYGVEATEKTEKIDGTLKTLFGVSKQVSDGLTEMDTKVSNELLPGSKALATGISELYTKGIDVMATGLNSLALKLPTLNDGIQALSSGSTQLQAGVNTLKDGTSALSTGTKSLQSGAGALATGVQQLATGGKQLKKGGATLADGVQQLADGSSQLKDGTSQLKDGGKDLDSGVDELLDGANELKDGMEEFDEEAIQKLVDFAEDDLQDMIDRLKDIRDAGDAYQLYSSGNENTNGNVKFIIETASIGDDE